MATTLVAHDRARKQEALKNGWTELPSWLFVSKTGMPLDVWNVRHSIDAVLRKTKLPLHLSSHCLRHTYASILLAEGLSSVFVQEQLGHVTIELTVSTYGRWLKKKAPRALDRLDAIEVDYVVAGAGGSKVVADGDFPQNPPRPDMLCNYRKDKEKVWCPRYELNVRPAV